MKPYLVTIEIEYAVMAVDERDAASIAHEAIDDVCFLEDCCSVSALNRYPDGWDEPHALVYWGKKVDKALIKDMTIKEATELSEEYQKQKALQKALLKARVGELTMKPLDKQDTTD